MKKSEGMGKRSYRLSDGVSFRADYPKNAAAVSLRLGDDYPGLKLASFIGNCGRLFIIDNRTSEIVLAQQVGNVEKFAFVLLDHKGRVYSRDYCFLNPLEHRQCMDEQRSDVLRTSKGTIMRVRKLVLTKSRLPPIDLFRLAEQPSIYLLSERLVQALRDNGCTNFVLNEVTVV
jgi:hypothetical protein